MCFVGCNLFVAYSHYSYSFWEPFCQFSGDSCGLAAFKVDSRCHVMVSRPKSLTSVCVLLPGCSLSSSRIHFCVQSWHLSWTGLLKPLMLSNSCATQRSSLCGETLCIGAQGNLRKEEFCTKNVDGLIELGVLCEKT